MIKLTEDQNEIIGKAYECYLKDISSEQQNLRYEKLENELNSFKEKLKSWRATDDIEFIIDFALSDEARAFAKDGTGKIQKEGFKQFMGSKLVKEKFEQMIYYKFNTDDDVKKYSNLLGCDIKQFLDSNKFDFDPPKLLVGKLLLMIFTELFTTIADDTALNDVCKKLEIAVKDKKKDVRYLSRQRQIRFKVDTYLKENNLYDEVKELGRARICWYITEV